MHYDPQVGGKVTRNKEHTHEKSRFRNHPDVLDSALG